MTSAIDPMVAEAREIQGDAAILEIKTNNDVLVQSPYCASIYEERMICTIKYDNGKAIALNRLFGDPEMWVQEEVGMPYVISNTTLGEWEMKGVENE